MDGTVDPKIGGGRINPGPSGRMVRTGGTTVAKVTAINAPQPATASAIGVAQSLATEATLDAWCVSWRRKRGGGVSLERAVTGPFSGAI